MKTSLVSYTGLGHPDSMYAAKLLAYTKNTRLNMTPVGLDSFMNKPNSEIMDELAYMATTIASSLEFIDVTFAINDISRATAQQITRTRTASFAMQSQRVSDMSGWGYDIGPTVSEENDEIFCLYHDAMSTIASTYDELVRLGVSMEDARNVLPLGVHCNLIAKYNFRAFVDLVKARESLRVQSSYRDIVAQMKREVLSVWPWADIFFEHKEALAIGLIESVAVDLAYMAEEKGAMYKGLSGKLAKAADLLKK